MFSSSSAPTGLAQVLLPEGPPRFVAHADSYHGLLVQRRYRRLREGPTEAPDSQTAWYEPYWHAFLWPELGQELAAVGEPPLPHPGQLLTHPAYRDRCLRWGASAGTAVQVRLYRHPRWPVAPAEMSGWGEWETHAGEPAASPLYFTPTTDWSSGQTCYRLDYEVAAGNARLAQAGLQWQAAGLAGQDPGWYTRDWAQAEAAARTTRQPSYAALRQHPLPTAQLRIYDGPGRVRSTRTLATLEQAWAEYTQAPAARADCTAQGAQLYPRLVLAWDRGYHAPDRLLADKALATGLVLTVPPDPGLPYLVPGQAFTALGLPLAPSYAPHSDGQWRAVLPADSAGALSC